MTTSLEQEIDAMRQIASALETLTPGARSRVIQYVLAQIGPEQPPATGIAVSEEDIDAPPAAIPAPFGQKKSDIRSLVREKQPKSAIEMVTLVAYYLAELAMERKDTINVTDLEKYFKQGAYPLPAGVRFALSNAKDAGYLEAASRGEYRLTAVGHNLVAHDMPTKTAGAEKSGPKRLRNTKGKKQQ